MFNLSTQIANILKNNNLIKEEDFDICRYGIEAFCLSVLEIISILIISLFIKNFVYTLLFFIAYIPLRLYAGGYHADTRLRCYLILVAVYAIFTLLIRQIPQNYIIITEIITIIFNLIVVTVYAPMSSYKKKISASEHRHYRKCSLVVVFSETAVIIIGILLFNENIFVLSFSLGSFAVTLSMMANVIKCNILGGTRNEEHEKN